MEALKEDIMFIDEYDDQDENDEVVLIRFLAVVMIVNGALVFLILQFTKSPYGRYGSSSWGPSIHPKVAWCIQELPSLLVPVFLIVFTDCPRLDNLPNVAILSLFLIHYIQRAIIFPFLIQGGKSTPLVPFILALFFCSYNGYMQTRYLLVYAQYPVGWIFEPRFVLGVVLFFLGMAINIHSDHILRNLRKPGETGYKIPEGGMFDYVSGSNFFGEILEWSGFALAAMSLPAFAFAFFTACNIGPRALHHHRWYQEKFRDVYPKNRKALIPLIL